MRDPMIYTLTPNPAIDMNVSCKSVVPNEVCRTTDAVYSPNGKGLNVSFTLEHFGVSSPIMGFFGGFSGQYIIDEAKQRVCRVLPVMIDGITRINPFISTPDCEYKFPNEGVAVGRGRIDELMHLLSAQDDIDMLVVSGSLPKDMPETFYDELFSCARTWICAHNNRGASQRENTSCADIHPFELVIDTSSSYLKNLGSAHPLLIKPNDDELREIFGLEVSSQEELMHTFHVLKDEGFQTALITLGKHGAYYLDMGEDGIWHASAPEIVMYSSACAGDACLGGFLAHRYGKNLSVETSLRYAMACGANAAESAGLGDFSRVDKLKEEVIVTRIL